MVIMALDHTRDFFHKGVPDPTNFATTTGFLFFTRWITHFCAPVFVFLSGVSVYLAGTRRTKKELSAFLIKRGLWLVAVELVIRTFSVTLNPAFHVIVLQVIWAIGVSMIILGLLIRTLSINIIGFIGILLFFGLNLLDGVALPKEGVWGVLQKIFLTAHADILPINAERYIIDRYAVLPWTGVMLLGYVFGTLYQKGYDPRRRKMILQVTGFSLIGLFLILRGGNVYGDAAPWSTQKNAIYTLFSFLNTTKYPASLLYLCMTLGPALIVLALVERVQKNKLTAVCIVYGNVPFFYYILHFYLIRLLGVALFFASGYGTDQIAANPVYPNYLFFPAGSGVNLAMVYLLWILIVAVLYLPCKWFGNYKRTHQQWWLSYL